MKIIFYPSINYNNKTEQFYANKLKISQTSKNQKKFIISNRTLN